MYAVIVPTYGALGMALCIVASALLLVFVHSILLANTKTLFFLLKQSTF